MKDDYRELLILNGRLEALKDFLKKNNNYVSADEIIAILGISDSAERENKECLNE